MHKIYRAKRYTLELVKEDTKEQYNLLYNYCETVVKHNPTSTSILKEDRSLNPPVLERMYFCLACMRVGFLDGCRLIIGLDGCFLKGLYKGQLLCVTGRDGNDNIYPIVMAYVEIEKEVQRARVEESFLESCFNIECQTTSENHERYSEVISKKRSKCDVIVNNISESFNSYILEARELPIIEMFEAIRRKCIHKLRLETDDYVDDCFKKERYLRVYSHMVNPVPGMHEYEESTLGIVNPPNVKNKVGKAKKEVDENPRQRGEMELLLLHKLKIPSQTVVLMEFFDFYVFSNFEVPQTATQTSSSIPPKARSRKQQTPQPRRIPNQASTTPVTQRTESVNALERLKKRMQPSLPRLQKMPQVSTSTNLRPPKRPQASSSNTSRPSTFKRQCCTSSTSQNSASDQGVRGKNPKTKNV
ncbi:hypothetical protein BUALT_Bualt19G0051100 [Buddleja alternifolia]|uniref:Uncharacterized protein n=1 Tax=Buddleja alternifolia TaxID=168488 RepID=A0AAV6W2A4_9LAMI|nr:hypothetical protein BUALT_Bualt19G0051100 [Buddleja alternifolia]